MKKSRLAKVYRFICLLSLSLILVLLSIIPIRLAIAINQAPQAQAFLILGGDPAREKFTAELAEWYPSLEIWVSSPPDPQKTLKTFRDVNVPKTKLNIDMSAVDTVTNFTSLVANFKQRQLQHLFLVTSDFHMLRAKAIATVVLGSQGIAFTPISVPSKQTNSESLLRIIRDIVRSFLWITTGHTGANL